MTPVLETLVWALLFTTVTAAVGPCLQFNGESYGRFDEGDPLTNRVHYRLKFKTKAQNALIFYAEQPYIQEAPIDYEGLFLRNGKLVYLVYNPTEWGTGSSSGLLVTSTESMADATWHTVEFFRNKEHTERIDDMDVTTIQSGMVIDGLETHVVEGMREGLQIQKPIWLGKHIDMDRLSRHVKGFKGKIRDFKDMITGAMFDPDSSSNYISDISRPTNC